MATYTRIPVVVEAEQLTDWRRIDTPDGTTYADPGQWIVTFPDGRQETLTDAVFTAEFSAGVLAPPPPPPSFPVPFAPVA